MKRRGEYLQRVAPHNEGITVPIFEVGLPRTRLDTSYFENETNHHGQWTARAFGQCAIYQTLRDLDSRQFQAPRDTHNLYHRMYMPPPMPTLHKALEYIEEAQYNEEKLRYGSANTFRKVPISSDLMRILYDEYNNADEYKPTTIIV